MTRRVAIFVIAFATSPTESGLSRRTAGPDSIGDYLRKAEQLFFDYFTSRGYSAEQARTLYHTPGKHTRDFVYSDVYQDFVKEQRR